MMAVNRYRLKNKAERGHPGAKLVLHLLQTPDKLLGTILFGNTITNICASMFATVLGFRFFGNAGLAYAPLLLVFVVLIFAEVAPKTLAATHPERIAFPASYLLVILQALLAPFVWLVKIVSNYLLLLLTGTRVTAQHIALSSEELRIAVNESSGYLHRTHQTMMLRILEMEKITVEELMIPRSELEAVDLSDDWNIVIERLATSHHTRVPVYEDSLDHFIGVVHVRKLFYLSQMAELNKQTLIKTIDEPDFIPENTLITTALINLQHKNKRFAVVVDEYGNIKGLITLEQILEEIVGKFTAIIPGAGNNITLQKDGSFLVQGNTSLREIKRTLNWKTPKCTAKTLNGMITEYLEDIPTTNMSLKISNHVIEILQTRDTAVVVARITPYTRSN